MDYCNNNKYLYSVCALVYLTLSWLLFFNIDKLGDDVNNINYLCF